MHEILKKTIDNYIVTKGNDEPLRDFVNKFGKEVLDIPYLEVAIAMEAFNMGLKKDSPFYEDLVNTLCKKLDKVRNRALRFIRLEEDMSTLCNVSWGQGKVAYEK